MLKGIKKIILLIILLIPFMVIADENYEMSVRYTNSYIDSFSEYQNYILFPKSGYYYNETLKNDSFTRGGFLSRKEYLITNYDNKSYLSPGVQYWTLTPGLSDNSKRYVIDFTDKEISKNYTSGIRITEFILPKTRVEGEGTKSNPWVFSSIYKVVLLTSDHKKGLISNQVGGNCNNKGQNLVTSMYEDESIDIQLCPTSGYEYLSTDCGGNISKVEGKQHMISVSNVKKNTSCKINFIVTVYKISLDTNGGSEIDTKELYLAPNRYWFKEKDDRITETQITKINQLPTKTGYTFNGFYTDKTSDIKLIDEVGNLISTSGYTTDGTMYARYNANKYTITFDKQYGSGGTTSITATYDSAMPVITPPTRTGYTFNGYYSGTNGSGTKYYNADGTSANKWNKASNTTLYANWTANKYTVTFDMQPGTGGTSSIEATYNSAMPAITLPTRTGYTFKGYYSEENGSGTQYYSADGKSTNNWNLTSNATLYASWTANKYTVTFDMQSGSGGTTSIEATYDSAMPSIILPTKSGYTFGGYYTGTNGSGTKYYNATGSSARSYLLNKNITLYAYWVMSEVTCSNYSTTIKCANLNTSLTNPIINYTGNCSISCVDSTEWRMKLLSSGTFTSSSAISVDAFLVGGGSAGSCCNCGTQYGGSGGRTTTASKIPLAANTNYSVTIGLGGNPNGGSGGTTTAFGTSIAGGTLTKGGSGGGGSMAYMIPLRPGASYGNNGTGGSGQGYTTCEFGEGTLSGCTRGTSYAYSGGGGGVGSTGNDYWAASAGGIGGGGAAGGGGNYNYQCMTRTGAPGTNYRGGGGGYGHTGGKGGTGVVVVRKAK